MTTSETDCTTITVTLPAAMAPAVADGDGTAAAIQREDRPAERFAGLNVLLVDDDPFNLKVLEKFLADTGPRIETAENGRVAIEKIAAARFDLVLMDMEMPVLNGLEAIARVRRMEKAAPAARPIVAVALSAHDDEAVRQRCRDAGFDAYLKKPVGRKDLVDTLHRWFAAGANEAGSALAGQKPPPSAEDASIVEIDADLENLIPAFLEAKRQELAALRQHLANGDIEAVRRVSHKLKGAFSLYGFGFLSDACADMERSASAGEQGAVEAKLDAVEKYWPTMEICFT